MLLDFVLQLHNLRGNNFTVACEIDLNENVPEKVYSLKNTRHSLGTTRWKSKLKVYTKNARSYIYVHMYTVYIYLIGSVRK